MSLKKKKPGKKGMKRGCISRTCVRSSKGSGLKELRMDSENKPFRLIYMWMLVWEEGLKPLTEARLGEMAWHSSSCMSLHQSPSEIPSACSLSTGSTGSRHSLRRSRTGLVWAATHLFNAAAFPSPAFLRPPRPLTRGQPRRQKVKNMSQKKKTYTLSTSLSDWQKKKKHFCFRDRELKFSQTAGLKVT